MLPFLPNDIRFSFFTADKEERLQSMVWNFPATLDRAVEDWAKFKVGVESGLFYPGQRERVLEWFEGFPRLWETIKLNFSTTPTGMISPHKRKTYDAAEKFVTTLSNEMQIQNQLGIAPIIIAGIIIAGIFGVGGAIWAIGYVGKQHNISRMIDEVTAGKLPPGILQEAVESDKAGIFSQITDIMKYGLLAGVLFMSWPYIKNVLPKGSRS